MVNLKLYTAEKNLQRRHIKRNKQKYKTLQMQTFKPDCEKYLSRKKEK